MYFHSSYRVWVLQHEFFSWILTCIFLYSHSSSSFMIEDKVYERRIVFLRIHSCCWIVLFCRWFPAKLFSIVLTYIYLSQSFLTSHLIRFVVLLFVLIQHLFSLFDVSRISVLIKIIFILKFIVLCLFISYQPGK